MPFITESSRSRADQYLYTLSLHIPSIPILQDSFQPNHLTSSIAVHFASMKLTLLLAAFLSTALVAAESDLTFAWFSDKACKNKVSDCTANGSLQGHCGVPNNVGSVRAGKGINAADMVDIYKGATGCNVDKIPPSGNQLTTSDGDTENPCFTFGGPFAGACALWTCKSCG